jgi:error-prone DNA polymerase
MFMTIEDETGAANVLVRPDVWERTGPEARRAAVLIVHGRIQRRGAVIHVIATRLEPCLRAAPEHAALPRMSRDFH